MVKWLKSIFFLLLASFFLVNPLRAEDLVASNMLYLDRAKLITQQTDLLKNRLQQADNELTSLKRHQTDQVAKLPSLQGAKTIRAHAELDISVAKSNRESIDIELAEAQQSVIRLEKDVEEIANQLNVFNVFGVKTARHEVLNVNALTNELKYRKNLLNLEKGRVSYLAELQRVADDILQLQQAKYHRIEALLKSQIVTRLREQQAQSEIDFQKQQSDLLKRLNQLYAQASKTPEEAKNSYDKLQDEIFYTNEEVNFTYLQMLTMRYQDQLQQLQVSVSHTSSISFLNKCKEQVQLLAKQLQHLKDLLNTRMQILKQHEILQTSAKAIKQNKSSDTLKIKRMNEQYQIAISDVLGIEQQMVNFRAVLDQALQHELSSRQGLPGLSEKAWLDVVEEVLLVPTLTFQALKSLSVTLLQALHLINYSKAIFLLCLQFVWAIGYMLLNQRLKRLTNEIAEHDDAGHLNPKRVALQLLQRNLLSLVIIANILTVFYFCEIPQQTSGVIIHVAIVWLFFKAIMTIARLCLLESAHDQSGHDVRLYYRLTGAFWVGGLITALTVFIHQLPIGYEIKDLSDQLFLLFLFVVSVFLLKSWQVVPNLILPHIDERRPYLKKAVRLVGLLVPVILLINSLSGLFGFVNLVLTMSWYESIFLCVLVGYLILRGLLVEAMAALSRYLISNVINGWLWMEAFLKPLDKVLRISLFISAWVVLFLLYGWDQQSPVVERLNTLLHYPIVQILNAPINLLNIVELAVTISLWYWAARWTREFVYRLLLSRIEDSGLRNSLAVFSQYTLIIIGILICLRILGIDLKTLTVVASLFAVSVGLGLRDLANNFVCGFLLLIERPLRVGDTVSIGNFEGEVVHIGGRAVTIRTWEHVDVLVPNAEIFSKSFTNWTSKDTVVRSTIPIKINRHDNPPNVQGIILQVLASHKDVLADPVPEVLIKEMSDAFVEFEIRYYVNLRQVPSRVGVRSDILLAIWKMFELHGIKPPYPHHEVHVKGNVMPVIEHHSL